MNRLFAAPRRVLAVGVLAAVAVVATGFGYAAVAADNQTYTGCLQNGDMTNVAIGSTPFKACPKNATQISWSQTGPPGTPGANGTNGVSVTSATEAAGANCASGGSKFTAANGVTFACNGAKGDKGDVGPAGSAAVYRNYGGPLQSIADGTMQTVASLTLPTGTYTLTATAAISGVGDTEFGQCFFAPGNVNGTVALAKVADGTERVPLIGDVTVTTASSPVFLRCLGFDGAIQALGGISATQVGTISASE
jgi:hypothetical protein